MIYHFDAYTLDSNRRELHGAGQAVPIESRVFEVLLYLLEHRDRVVSKDELFEQCWPDTFVSASALTHCVTKLRRAVRPLSGATDVIKTVHRQGYRFAVEVEVTDGGDLAVPAAQPIPASEPLALAPELPETPGPIILVVEDEPTNRELLERQLHRCGYATRSASNGQEALDQVTAEAPDLILLDVRMPVLDGFAVCRQLKTQPSTRLIPIILLTALDEPQDRHTGLEAGADAFLTKPVNRQELLAQIETALRPPQSATHPSAENGLDPEDPETPVAPPSTLSSPASDPALTATAERRQLTVLSCTLIGATGLAMQLDPEELHDVLRTFHSTCAAIVAPFEGQVAQRLDDGVLIYFGYPQAHEDDVQRAVRSGLALAEAVRQGAMGTGALPEIHLALRVGIATGMMIVTSGATPDSPPTLGVGGASSLAVRLGALAPPGTVVIGEATAQLVAGYFECKVLETLRLSADPEGLVGYEVLGQSPSQTRLEVESAHGLTPFVGREAEVALVQERCIYVQEGLGQMILIQGEAGTGKSRLVQVLKEQVVGEWPRVLECRCSAHHQNTAFYPLIELTQRVLQGESETSPAERLERLEAMLAQNDIDLEEAVPLLADLLSLPLPEGRYAPLNVTPGRQCECTLDALVSFFLVQTATSPLLLVVEDVHWSDPSTLECLRLLSEQVATASMLVVLTSRAGFELPWGQYPEITPVMLTRLNRAQTAQMITQVAGKPLPESVIEQLVDKTNGVPLFVEELTRMVLEGGQLVERVGHAPLSGEPVELTIPVTLHDSLMARLDRLGAAKEIAQWGSVLGREFSYELLEAVMPCKVSALQTGLAQLVAAELLYQRGRPPRATYLFKHALIQDAAYASLLRSTREQVHLRIAAHLERAYFNDVDLVVELLAYHFTQGREVSRALEYLHRASVKALRRFAATEAIAHLHAALELLPVLPAKRDRERMEYDLQSTLGTAIVSAQGVRVPQARTAYERAYQLGRRFGDVEQLFPSLVGLEITAAGQANYMQSQHLCGQLLSYAQITQHPLHLAYAYCALSLNHALQGHDLIAHHYAQACQRLPISPEWAHHLAYTINPVLFCQRWHVIVMVELGYPAQAVALSQAVLARTRALGDPSILPQGLVAVASVNLYCLPPIALYEVAQELLAYSQQHELLHWEQLGKIFVLQARARLGMAPAECPAQLEAILGAYRETGVRQGTSLMLFSAADTCYHAGHIEAGLAFLQQAETYIEETGERMFETALHWHQGKLMQRRGDVAQAEMCFARSLSLAHQRGARGTELRVATLLSRLWQEQGEPERARDLLLPIYNGFTEGFDTAELQAAKALLDQLA